jgi:DNA repair exonuclease SbcCD nuclease subunit
MKALYFTDLHVHNYKQFDTDASRLHNCLRVIDILFQYANKNHIEYILFGGDLYDRQKAIPTVVVNSVVAKFTHLFQTYKDIKFVAISGNHDHASANLLHSPAETSLTHLNTIFDNFILIDNDSHTLEIGLQVHGIPYYEYADDYHTQLSTVRTLDISYLFIKPPTVL